MKYRLTELLAQKTLDASGTEVIDVKLSDPISMLLFEYKNTPGSNTMAGHVASCLSKIELVDGSDVIFSMSGKEMQALAYYSAKMVPYCVVSNAIGVQQIVAIPYFFGRRLWDPMLALDTKKFKNPQIKITHNRVTSDASSTAHTLKVLAYAFDEKAISPTGFLMSKEIKSYTSPANAAYEYTDIPTDYILRKLLIAAYTADYQPWQVANEIRLSEDNAKRIPVDEKLSTLMKLSNAEYPKLREFLYAVLTSGGADIYWTPQFDVNVQGMSELASAILNAEGQPMTSPKKLYSSSSGNAIVEVSGFAPHGVMPVDFGDQDDMDDWYDVTKLGSLEARIMAGSAGTGGTVALVTQQLRKY